MFKISNYNDLTKSANDLFHFDSNGNGGDIIVDSGLFPILWTIASIDKKYNNKDKITIKIFIAMMILTIMLSLFIANEC